MKIQLLMTGNELMSGDTLDANSAWIGGRLRALGLQVARKVTLGDSLDALVDELDQLCRTADLVLINGGLGPTRDDLTAEALSRLTGRPLREHPEARAHLESWCAARGVRLNAANLKQALLPDGAAIVPNPRGSAVGIRLRHHDCELICTPGVPSEMRAMVDATVIPWLEERVGPDQRRLGLRWHVFGLGESTLQQWIDDRIPDWPAEVELGFRAGAPTLEVKLSAARQAQAQLQNCSAKLRALIGDYIVAEEATSQAGALIETLKNAGRTLALAESCTGGLIAARLTAEAGASAVFHCGVVAYANEIKERLLGVSSETLAREGAVSEAVVREMVTGVLALSGADYGIAVSGIAGPEGGSDEKPVGTVWIAWGDKARIDTACLRLPTPRPLFQTLTAGTALDLIRRRDQGIEALPDYLVQRRGPGLGSAQRECP